MKKILLSIVALLSLYHIALGQEEEVIKKKASVAFVYPISSNGSNINVENTASFNILFGANAGVKGGELSGFGAYNKGNVTGGQFAGGFNATKGDVKGAQFAGLFNATHGNSKGVQIAGIANASKENSTGFQFGGVGNVTLGNQNGVVVSGVSNFTKGNVSGAQVGVVNVGLQKVNGLQTGVVNIADTLSGVQFGVINISKNVEKGTPIGLINIVKNGYYAIELTAGEINVASLSYKMGTTDFYTIFKYGYTPDYVSTTTNHSVGLGFGTLRNLSRNGRHQLAIDLTANHYLPYQGADKIDSDNKINMMGKLDLNYHYKINDHIAVVGGPSLNGYYSEVRSSDNGSFGTLTLPSETMIHQEFNETNTQAVWVGFNLGINYTF
ncbi:hypothetical protein [Flammeovirga sp. SJP92]|uniref:hypothetical protein n=1 Tax=Flammeovirga sp. SJP92 TaxID=1775430 RepID=UPI000786BFD6|nr:hypothetical protein [Flammeovirga sp. SJP92]KXX69908.1 hypothetical protein AVL50_13585 [Flammeovirga sp. SJP92]